MAINDSTWSRRGLWRRFASTNRVRSRQTAMATPMAEMPQRVAEQTETWWSDQKIRRALFKDLIHWLQLHIEIDRDWRSGSYRSRKSAFSQPPKAASFS